MSVTDWLIGINAVEGQLQADPTRLVDLWVEQGQKNPRVDALIREAKRLGVPVQVIVSANLVKKISSDRHQGVAAQYKLPEMLTDADIAPLVEQAGKRALFLVLDGVQDPHNLGACIRSAAAAGATAVIIPRDKAVGLTAVVARAAVGTLARMPVVQVANLARALEKLKSLGIWCYGAAGEAQKSLYATDLTGLVAIVMGSEGEGLRRLTKDTCDGLLRIPMASDVESLNVSVATGVCLFEVLRQRSTKN
jgi:23S rRNA (guanosine2251-2'-O)-methyltransferase